MNWTLTHERRNPQKIQSSIWLKLKEVFDARSQIVAWKPRLKSLLWHKKERSYITHQRKVNITLLILENSYYYALFKFVKIQKTLHNFEHAAITVSASFSPRVSRDHLRLIETWWYKTKEMKFLWCNQIKIIIGFRIQRRNRRDGNKKYKMDVRRAEAKNTEYEKLIRNDWKIKMERRGVGIKT